MSRRGLTCIVSLVCLICPPGTVTAAAGGGAVSCVFQVTEPYPEQEAAAGMPVEGLALLEPGHHLWVFARRVDFAPLWWPQGEGVPDPSSGRWKVLAHLGEPRDLGWSFDLAVAVFAGEEHARLGEWLARAQESGDFKPLEMPVFVCSPELRTLRRTRAE